MTDMYI